MSDSTEIDRPSQLPVVVKATTISPWPTWIATSLSGAVGLVVVSGFSWFFLGITAKPTAEAIKALGDIVLLLPSIAAAPSLWLIWSWRTIYREQELANAQALLVWDKEKTRQENEKEALRVAAELKKAQIIAKTASDQLDAERTEKEALRTAAEVEAAFQQSQAEQRLHSERFTQAAEMLSSEKGSIQLAAIYSLERIAHDSEVYRKTVHDLLCAFVRTTTPRPSGEEEEGGKSEKLPETIQAALNVLVRRSPLKDAGWMVDLSDCNLNRTDLRGADLTRADLTGADLYKANLTRANLNKAHLYRANLTRANLTRADLTRANFYKANLIEADLRGADLRGADLTRADLNKANLIEADLTRADLNEANLRKVNFNGADLTRADLRGADLTRANLYKANLIRADLKGASLTDIIYDDTTTWPDDFTPPPSAE